VAKLTIVFGVILLLLGFVAYALSDRASLTPMIPSVVGALLAVLGVIATNDAARKHAMHAAAAVGTLGALAAALRLIMVLATGRVPSALGLVSLVGMLVLCGAFVALCVRSFIDARRRRQAETPTAA
jgi:hypothetical protein